MTQLRKIRAHAVTHSLPAPTTLAAAMARLGFVQADPIRAPARAQDLILRHRAEGYRAGDLDRHYSSLDLEEDYLYAYGFLSRAAWQLLQPRAASPLPALEEKILNAVRAAGTLHPGELPERFGKERVINAWGGYSQATKRALERLHFRGLVRVARREKGVRVYAAARTPDDSLPPAERLRKAIWVTANLLAPVPERTLQAIASRLRRFIPRAPQPRAVLRDLLRTGELEAACVDEIKYVWPAQNGPRDDPPRQVRILAPFDPIVWDRGRFEHLWQWAYRFEAYTPPARRVRGYYAMPVLWCDRVIGWANAEVNGPGLIIRFGFAGRQPRDNAFRRETEAEVWRFKDFLDLNRGQR